MKLKFKYSTKSELSLFRLIPNNDDFCNILCSPDVDESELLQNNEVITKRKIMFVHKTWFKKDRW